jgi:hypothetical protein
MAHTVDSISIRGLRKTHLLQLVRYIQNRDNEGWYYGQRDQFERRHADLLALADRIKAIVNDPDARLPNTTGERPKTRSEDSMKKTTEARVSGTLDPFVGQSGGCE